MQMRISPRRLATIKRTLSSKPLLPAIIVFITAFLLRVDKIAFRSIWMDEDAQATVAGEWSLPRIAYKAARHHQPPIDYYAEKIGLTLFGYTEVGARIHAVMWSALAAALFFILLTRQLRHPVAIGMGALFFILHPDLVRYATEGRPISCGVFFATLFLYVLSHHFSRPVAGRYATAKQFGLLFASEFGLLLSVGFQPVVLVVTVFIAATSHALCARSRKRAMVFMAASLTATAAALPVLMLGVANGEAYLGTATPLERLGKIATNLSTFDTISYQQKLLPLIGDLLPILIAALPLATLNWTYRLKLTRKRLMDIALLLTLLLYPVIFDTLFNALINYSIALRYYLTLAPFALLAAARIIDDAIIALRSLTAAKSLYARTAACSVIALLLTLSTNHLVDGIHDRNKASVRTDWRSLFGYIRTSVPSNSNAYLFNLVPEGRWAPPRFYTEKFYYPEAKGRPAALYRENVLIPHYRKAENRWKKDVLFVTPYGYESIHGQLFSDNKDVAVLRFHRLSVIHIKHGRNMRHRVRRIFERLASQVEKTEKNYLVFETLGWMQLFDGERNTALKTVNILKEIDKRGALSASIIAPLSDAVFNDK